MTDENEPSKESTEDAKAKKRKERLEQNRISARESRRRKKTMIEELQRTVISLSRENKELNDTNAALRKQLMELATKHPNVVSMQSIMPAQAVAPSGDAQAAATTAAEASAAISSQTPAASAAPTPAATPAFPAGMFFFPGAAPGQAWDPAQFQQQAAQVVQQQVAQQAAAAAAAQQQAAAAAAQAAAAPPAAQPQEQVEESPAPAACDAVDAV